MSVELVTLGFLMSGPKSGYKLQSIANKMMLFYNISLNQVYPALRKLEKAGHVQKELVIQTGKPNKNVFTITDSGREHFMALLTGPPEPLDVCFPFLVRSLFFRFLDSEDTVNELEKEVFSLEGQLAELERVSRNVKTQADEHGDFVYRTAVHMVRSMLDFYRDEISKRQNK